MCVCVCMCVCVYVYVCASVSQASHWSGERDRKRVRFFSPLRFAAFQFFGGCKGVGFFFSRWDDGDGWAETAPPSRFEGWWRGGGEKGCRKRRAIRGSRMEQAVPVVRSSKIRNHPLVTLFSSAPYVLLRTPYQVLESLRVQRSAVQNAALVAPWRSALSLAPSLYIGALARSRPLTNRWASLAHHIRFSPAKPSATLLAYLLERRKQRGTGKQGFLFVMGKSIVKR